LGISFGSINTGLPKDIVKQIMAAEKIPLQRMEARKAKYNDKKKLVDELINILSTIKGDLYAQGDERSFNEFKLNYNEDIVDITADKYTARAGSHQFEVLQLAQKSSAMTSGFENRDDYIGVGFIQYKLPNGESQSVYVDSNSSTLDGVMKLINDDKTNGMNAKVIHDGKSEDKPWKLILALENTGDNMLAEFPYFYFVDGEKDFYVDQERPAQDAIVRLDGFEVELPANKASDLIPGLTIDLLKAAPGDEFTIKVEADVDKMTIKIQDLIEKINQALKFIIDQNTIDEKSDTSRTLGGDVTIQAIESRLRSIVFQTLKTEFGPVRLGDLGVRFQRDGLLEFDEEYFKNKLSSKGKMVKQFLTGYFDEDKNRVLGFIKTFTKNIEGFLRSPDGTLQNRKNGIKSNISQIDRQIESRERILEQKEKHLKDKFARLEATVNRLKSQGAGLAGMGGGAMNPVQQLVS
jgi:flagellar hook-associated protein 2